MTSLSLPTPISLPQTTEPPNHSLSVPLIHYETSYMVENEKECGSCIFYRSQTEEDITIMKEDLNQITAGSREHTGDDACLVSFPLTYQNNCFHLNVVLYVSVNPQPKSDYFVHLVQPKSQDSRLHQIQRDAAFLL